MHYDLAWNPTRHEQREGRVDRFGQPKPEVRVLTYYGADNPIDGVILEVLLRKHKSIKSDLGVTVSVPGSSEQIAEALFHAALFKERTRSSPQQQLSLGFIDDLPAKTQQVHAEWDNARDREKASRSRYAQHSLKPDAVAEELAAIRQAIGQQQEVEGFFKTALRAADVPLQDKAGVLTVNLNQNIPRSLRQALGRDESFAGRFELPLDDGQLYLGRTSPLVEGLASWVVDQALDAVARDARAVAARCGVTSTADVTARTVLLVARFRYQLTSPGSNGAVLLVEEIQPLACTGPADSPVWLSEQDSEALLMSTLPKLQTALGALAESRAQLQLQAHERVREAARHKGKISVAPVLPVDILGAYTLLPRIG